jgi:PAS domain S-box-containing protein
MPENLRRTLSELKKLGTAEEFPVLKEKLLEDLNALLLDYEKLKFKYERSVKEKNILSSLLTRTSADLKKVSDSLKIRAEQLSVLLSTIPAYVYFKDTRLRYIIVNRHFADFAGMPAAEIEGKTAGEVIPGMNALRIIETEKEVLKTGTAQYELEEPVVFNGIERWISTSLAPVKDPAGSIIGLTGIIRDVTERREYETALRQAKELAEAGTQAKNEFIASVSHEFRTPMNGILGLAEMMKNTTLDEAQEDLLKGIVTSAENLLVLVNDLLDFSAIEAGKMELDFHPFMLDRVLDDCFYALEMKAREKSLDFSVSVQPGVPNHLYGDSKRLSQILLNLVNNAVKFTEKGGIAVSVMQEERASARIWLRFEVRDTGIGIPSDAIGSLFKVFSRVRQERQKLVSGTGLGLSICRKLTDILGGEIGVESVAGSGSLFWFTLPFDKDGPRVLNPSRKVRNPSHSFNGKRVLVAEDNLINQKIVAFQLRRLGFLVDLTDNGAMAYERYLAETYDLVILDIQMPVMDGFEVARRIRMLEKTKGGHIPVVALTANAMKGDREQYLAAGMDAYVSKPFTVETLLEAIEEACANN